MNNKYVHWLYTAIILSGVLGCDDETSTKAPSSTSSLSGEMMSDDTSGDSGGATMSQMGGEMTMIGGMMIAMGGTSSATEACQDVCDVLLNCGWVLNCSDRTRMDAQSSCQSLCQGDQAQQILNLAGSTCADSEVSLPQILGISEACQNDLCADQQCEAGSICDPTTGDCMDACAQIECDTNLVCQEGQCVNLCEETTCAEGEACDSSTGQCAPICDVITCAETERCQPESGQCIPRCEGVECEEGLVCEATTGECTDLCDGVECDVGFICEPTSGTCIDVCADVECEEGWSCQAGICAFDAPCGGEECMGTDSCNYTTQRCEPYTCGNDRFELGFTNNLALNATPISGMTQYLDELSICLADTDWYVMAVPAGSGLRASLYSTPTAGPLMIGWYTLDDLFTPIYESDTRSSLEEIFIPALEVEQNVYFRVSSANGTISLNRYVLAVEVGEFDVECNGTEASSVGCEMGQNCEAGVCVADGTGSNDPTDPTDSTDPTDPTDPNNPNDPNDPNSECMIDSFEPNEIEQEATPVGDQDVWNGSICLGDIDLFSITLTEVSDLLISVSFNHAAGDIDLSLLDSDFVRVDFSDSLTDDEEIDISALEAGSYYISIYGYQDLVENTYEMTITQTP